MALIVTPLPPLYDHQVAGRDHLLRTPRAALFLDMALGKSRIVLESLTPDHLPALVVAPKRVAEEVWPAEQEKWRPDLSLRLAVGNPAQRQAVLSQRADITVIGRDNLGDLLKNYRGSWRTLVLDELSGYKSRGTRWKIARQVALQIDHVWGLTGTPAPNGYLDLWPQVFLLDHGARLGKNITTYRSRYFYPGRQLPNGVITDWTLKDGAKEKIETAISDICMSMTAEDRIDLPPVLYNQVQVDLPPKVRKVYDEFKKTLVADLSIFDGVVHTASGAASLTNRLSQLLAGFIYDDEDGTYDWVHNEKIDAAKEVIEETGSPVLVFYRFAPERDALLKALPQARLVNEPGIIKEWNRREVPVLLAHPLSAGHGLNLQDGGHTALWTSIPWDLELWQQGNTRLPRPGQANSHVVTHMLMVKNSVDQLILSRLEGKTDVQDSLREALESVF